MKNSSNQLVWKLDALILKKMKQIDQSKFYGPKYKFKMVQKICLTIRFLNDEGKEPNRLRNGDGP